MTSSGLRAGESRGGVAWRERNMGLPPSAHREVIFGTGLLGDEG